MGSEADHPDGLIIDVQEGPHEERYQPVRLVTRRGEVACRFYGVPAARRGCLWVGGVGGGWDTPARGLYPRLCEVLLGEDMASLRVRFRDPRSLADAVHDVQAGLAYLQTQGIDRLGLVGHSFGGAVVIQAAAANPVVRTVVTLATQSYGTEPAARLGLRCSILLLHGTADRVLPARCSEYTHRIARAPKQLILYPGAGHVLDEVADDVYRTIRGWIVSQLPDA